MGFFNRYFWDGRAGSLEEQTLGPIQSSVEMYQNLDELEAELAVIPGYVTEFKNVFGTKPNRDGIAKVVTFYYRGIPAKDRDHLPLDVEALSGQSFSEISLIVEFLKSLTGKMPTSEPPKIP